MAGHTLARPCVRGCAIWPHSVGARKASLDRGKEPNTIDELRAHVVATPCLVGPVGCEPTTRRCIDLALPRRAKEPTLYIGGGVSVGRLVVGARGSTSVVELVESRARGARATSRRRELRLTELLPATVSELSGDT